MREYLSSGFSVWSYAVDAERFEVRMRFTAWAARVVQSVKASQPGYRHVEERRK